jgi:hypothetical protein
MPEPTSEQSDIGERCRDRERQVWEFLAGQFPDYRHSMVVQARGLHDALLARGDPSS